MTRRSPALRSPRGASGFTLLEAIVAMVVFSLGAFALFGWLSTNIITLERIKQRQHLESATHSALDLIRRSNPMETPEGRRQAGDLIVTWSAKLVEPAKMGSSQSGAPTSFAMGLYDLDVQVFRNGVQAHRFQVRQMGWKQIGGLAE